MPKVTHPPPPRRSPSKRPPPKPQRAEFTGPMKFGFNSRGVFITGEDARNLLKDLLAAHPTLLTGINENEKVLRDLAKILTWADESSEKRVQSMNPYFESFRGLDIK
jgi:hypothetical protein